MGKIPWHNTSTPPAKQGKSRGSVGTTDQGKGKRSREGKIGQGGRGRTQGGERLMGATAYGGKGQGKGKGSREGKIGKEEEEGLRVVRGRWAPPHMEGKGPREGQQMAIGQ